MKRFISVFLSVVILLLSVPMSVSAAEAYTEGGYTYTVENGTATITEVSEHISGDVTVPDTLGGYPVTVIGDHAFYLRGDITSVTVPDGVIRIGKGVFDSCEKMTSVTLPDSVTDIGYYAFASCSSLKAAVIPKNVTVVNTLFYGCTSLEEVVLPTGLKEINSGSFSYCENLKSITIPNGVTDIGNRAFSYCKSLTSVTIPDSVTEVGRNAFDGCSSLKSIHIGKGMARYIDAFSNCENLTEITVSGGNTLFSSVDGVLFSKDKRTLIQYPAGRTDKEYSIPGSVTTVGRNAFDGCSSLKSIHIGKGMVRYIDAFSNCENLTEITVSGGNTLFSSVDGVLFSKDKKTLIRYPAGRTDKEYSIPVGVTTIGQGAFWECENLTSIIIPNSVTVIESYAFAKCKNLVDISIPDKVAELDVCTFLNCESLTGLIIPESVTKISDSAFLKCDKIYLYCYPDSYACRFAKDSGIPFIIFDHALPGDANDDTSLTLTDVSVTLKYIAEWGTKINTDEADMDKNGTVDLWDASLMIKQISHLDIIQKK